MATVPIPGSSPGTEPGRKLRKRIAARAQGEVNACILAGFLFAYLAKLGPTY